MMIRLRHTAPVFAAFAVLVLLGATLAHGRDADDDLEALKQRVQALEETGARNAVLVKEQGDALKRIDAFFAGLPAILDNLDKKMNDARVNGFEMAGPNPRARTDILEGIKSFCASIKAARPGAKAEDEATPAKD